MDLTPDNGIIKPPAGSSLVSATVEGCATSKSASWAHASTTRHFPAPPWNRRRHRVSYGTKGP